MQYSHRWRQSTGQELVTILIYWTSKSRLIPFVLFRFQKRDPYSKLTITTRYVSNVKDVSDRYMQFWENQMTNKLGLLVWRRVGQETSEWLSQSQSGRRRGIRNSSQQIRKDQESRFDCQVSRVDEPVCNLLCRRVQVPRFACGQTASFVGKAGQGDVRWCSSTPAAKARVKALLVCSFSSADAGVCSYVGTTCLVRIWTWISLMEIMLHRWI